MFKIKKISIFLALFLVLISSSCAFASGAYYLPDVTSQMSSPAFWTQETDILMSYEEIEMLNTKTITAKGTVIG